MFHVFIRIRMAGVVDLTSDVVQVVDLTVDEPPAKPAAGLAGGKRLRSEAGSTLQGESLASLDRTQVAEKLAKLLPCPVCLDAPMNEMSSTLCGHLFCGPCIAKCAETLKQCPTCKTKIKKGSFHRVFL